MNANRCGSGSLLLFSGCLLFTGSSVVLSAGSHPGRVVIDRTRGDTSVTVATPAGVSLVVPLLPSSPVPGNSGPETPSGGSDWNLKFSATGKVFKDVSFVSPLVGYLVTELGAVYRTGDNGETWQLKMNLGFPYYWYGVDALTPDTVVISGFNNQGNISDGVIRWSFDGGATWSDDILLSVPSGVGWLDRIHFFGPDTGIVMAGFSGGVHYTTTGGRDAGAWTYVQVNPDMGWFAGNIDAQTGGDVYATGIHLGHSTDFGATWTSMPPADGVFDGGVDFLEPDNQLGLTGGGQISAPVQGWTHRTTDGGGTWSTRLMTFPYPIRAVRLLTDSLGFAVGGNVYGESGGIYRSTDGGFTWNLDEETNAEMFSIEVVNLTADTVDIWCAGSTGGSTGFTGRLYKARLSLSSVTTDVAHQSIPLPGTTELEPSFPNPFNPTTTFRFTLHTRRFVTLSVFDLLGGTVATVVNEELAPGTYSRRWDAPAGLASGIYFYRLSTDDLVQTGKLVLLR